jgi:hypothetical protein
MGKIAIDLDDDTLTKAQQVATERNTTLPQMVAEFVRSVAYQSGPDRAKAAELLRETFKQFSRDMGPRTWKREDLYER